MAVSVNVPALVRLFQEQHRAIGGAIIAIDPSSVSEAPFGHCVGVWMKDEDVEALRLEGCDLLLGLDGELSVGRDRRIGADRLEPLVIPFDWPKNDSSGFEHGVLLIKRATVPPGDDESTTANDATQEERAA
jgi:hypothetical protein